MKNFKVGQKVMVTFSRIGQENLVFESTVMDVVDNHREQGVWVDHNECPGDDMMYVSLVNPNVNSVEVIEPTVVEIRKEEHMAIKDIRAELNKAIKYIDEDDTIEVSVKVYDCSENDEQTYDVEINLYINGEYTDGWYNDTFYGVLENDEVNARAEKMAVQRAKAVLRSVKGWFQYNDLVTVDNTIEVYHV